MNSSPHHPMRVLLAQMAQAYRFGGRSVVTNGRAGAAEEGFSAMLGTILIIVLILLLLGAFPRAGAYNAGWGYAPSGGLGVILLIVIILLLMGRI